MVTVRAPEGLKVARLPSCILTPNGYMDHPSWHATPGAVPQLGVTKIKWFLKGQACDKQYVVESDAGASTDPAVVQQLRAIETIEPLGITRLQRAYEKYKHQVQRLPKGSNISHLRNPAESNREQKRRAKREAYKADQVGLYTIFFY